MRFLITDTYYHQFWRSVYAQDRALAGRSYREQLGALLSLCFGTSDFYSANLRALGHEAEDVITNCEPLQRQWAREHAPGLLRGKDWRLRVLAAQVRAAAPDVLYVQDIGWPAADFYRELTPAVPLIVGQTAYPLLPRFDYGAFDLVFTSFPHYVTLLGRVGIESHYVPLAFEGRVLERLGPLPAPRYDAAFVGGVSRHHGGGTGVLERVAREVPLETWGYGYDRLPKDAALRRRYHGPAFGLEMFRVLAESRIVLNRHIDHAGRFANNMRLYETTGVGACLVTDRRDNLAELFEPGREVVEYDSPAECVEKVRYYLEHETERAAIAAAGQRRTLTEHTYARRMAEVDRVVEQRLRRPTQRERRIFLVEAPPRPTPTGQLVSRAGRLVAHLPPPVQRLATWSYQRVSQLAARSRIGVDPDRRQIAGTDVSPELRRAWTAAEIPERQWELARKQLALMYVGETPTEFRIAAEAIRATGSTDPMIVEVGCATAYHAEALGHLLRRRLRYLGIDYSLPQIAAAAVRYPGLPLLVGDAARLPVAEKSCDVLLSAAVLLHVPDYAAAIAESARVTSRWCIFHRTPVTLGPTRHMTKLAYGVEVVELAFNRADLIDHFSRSALRIVRELPIYGYRLPGGGEVTVTTFVCAV